MRRDHWFARLDSKNRVTLPPEIRNTLGVKPGDGIYFVPVGKMAYVTSDYQIALGRLKDPKDPVISGDELLKRLISQEVKRG